MRKIQLALVVLGLLALAFVGGRYTASPLALISPEGLLDDPLDQAWQDFIRAQNESLALFRNSDFFADDQERAEAYRSLLYALVGSIKVGALMNADHPRFMRASDWTSKRGLENPDNNYYIAMIRDDADYRIVGERGSSRGLVFQLLVGVPAVKGAGSSTAVSTLYSSDIHIEDDGRFEVLVSRNKPETGNWLANGDGAQTLLARFSHDDWHSERPGRLRIERLGAEGESAIPLTPGRMALGLQEAAISLFDSSATWLQFAERIWQTMPRNQISRPGATRAGLVGQYSAFGTWALDNDQAIILSVYPAEASYQGIELGNLWFTSLDYETRTSSLSLSQMHCIPDARCYAVISHRDPGIQNWLDTEGHLRGLIMLRWQGLSEAMPESEYPQARLVRFEDLHIELPAGIPAYSAQQRWQQIQQRRANVQERFDG